MKKYFFVLSVLFSSVANASDAFHSEFSHFSGGLVMTLLAALVVVNFLKKHRNEAILWAFWVSTIFVSVAQTRDFLLSGKPWSQALDFFAHTIGTLLAVYILRKFIRPANNHYASDTKA